ncbi:MAG: D-alanyl-D-alanine carboxypeptidase, partial [Lachnospiraceae bacterium]
MIILSSQFYVFAEETAQIEENSLHAISAVLMDASSGRILYEKNGQEFMANASTTKILTCIMALEEGDNNKPVQVSAYAASMPDVQLNIREGEQYLLEDLLYSLMLESHNDT